MIYMTQAVPEAKTTPQPTPDETQETNGFGVPTAGQNEPITNTQAVVTAAQNLEAETGVVDFATKEITEDQNVSAQPSAEHTQPTDIHPEVIAVGVEVVSPHEEVQELDAAAQALGGGVVGSVASTQGLGQAQVEMNPQPSPEPELIISETDAFDARKSRKFEKGEGSVYRSAVMGRFKELLHAKIPKIFGGRKEIPTAQGQNNVIPFPQPQETKKAA